MLVLYCVLLASFVVWTFFNCMALPKPKEGAFTPQLVSVLIPMRNEASNAQHCIDMLKKLSYPELQFVIYNDHSTDDTAAIVHQATLHDTRFQIVEGGPLPQGWVGKVHACHQLSKYAKGEYFAFVDADVTLAQDTFEKMISTMQRRQVGLITGFPRFYYTNWLDRLVIPMMHFFVNFHLPIYLANQTTWPAATAANGAFLLFDKETYEKIGGHTSVQHSLLEDVEITRAVKRQNRRVLLTNVTDDVSCKMYSNSQQTWEGFSKNTFHGLGYSLVNAFLFSGFYAVCFILPLVLALYGIGSGQWLYSLPYALIIMQRMISDWTSKTPVYYTFFMPLSTIAVLSILWNSVYTHYTKKTYRWKGREYS